MIRRDYFLRLIEEAGMVLQQMLTYKHEKRYSEALNLAAEAFQGFFQINWEEIRSTPPEDLPGWLVDAHGLDADRIEIAADLLRQSAEIAFDAGNWPECRQYILQALSLQHYLGVTQSTVYSFTRVANKAWLQTHLSILDESESNS